MGYQRLLCLFLVLFTGLIGLLQAYQFNVGGQEGWVLNPPENYNHWAQRMRFQVNDTIFFRYKKGLDSVLVVTKEDYDDCNTQKPIVKMDGGDSVFKFDRSGPFYFISGNKTHCDNCQKLIVFVLAVRNKPIYLPPAPAPFPKFVSPTTSPSPAYRPPSGAPSTAPAPAPASDNSGNINAPVLPPSHSSAPVFTRSVVFMQSVTLVMSLCLCV